MIEDYLHPKERDAVVKPYNPHVYTFGCFDEAGKLVAYYMFEKFTIFFHVVKGIGHADYLSFGIMNYLWAYSISELSCLGEDAEYLIYGTMSIDKKDGLSNFKRHAGCEQKHVFLRGDRQQMRALERFNKTYKLHDDTALNLVSEYENDALC